MLFMVSLAKSRSKLCLSADFNIDLKKFFHPHIDWGSRRQLCFLSFYAKKLVPNVQKRPLNVKQEE